MLDRVAAEAHQAGDDFETFVDFRDMIGRSDIDAVSIATPNHLHTLLAIWALQAGKDVYIEKPVSHNVWEGRQLVRAAARYGRIIEPGTQCRSSDGIAAAVEWVRAGNLGRITAARGLCYKRRASIGKTTGPQPVPETVNYDLWLGPAPQAAPRRKRFHYDWHWFNAYGNGDLGNQGIHQMDIARWFLGEPALSPRVFSVGGRFGYDDDGETPNTQVVVHDYPGAPLIFEVRGLPAGPVVEVPADPNAQPQPMDQYHGASIGVVVHCEGGTVVVPSYTRAEAFTTDGEKILTWEGGRSHFANFIESVRARDPKHQRISIEEGHISSALCHTSMISQRLGHELGADRVREHIKGNAAMTEAFGRMSGHLAVHGIDLTRTRATLGLPLAMDPATERFSGANAEEANRLLTRDYRAPFVVPAFTA